MGLIWTYLLLAVIILPTAALAFLPSPPSPQTASQRKEGRIDPLLIVLIALVFACYSGASAAYGGWIYTYALKSNLANANDAAYLSSIFWAALSAGRLAAIPLAIRFKPQAILRADFLGALLSLLAMLLWPRSLAPSSSPRSDFGFALASIYPTTMSFSGQLMTISGRVTGLFSIGASVGGMILPWLVGQFFDTTGPQSMTPVLFIDMLIALGVLAILARYTVPQPVTGEVPDPILPPIFTIQNLPHPPLASGPPCSSHPARPPATVGSCSSVRVTARNRSSCHPRSTPGDTPWDELNAISWNAGRYDPYNTG